MSDYLIDEKTLTSFADSARGIYNKTGILTGQQIVDDINGVASEVSEQAGLIDKIGRKFFDKDIIPYLNREITSIYNSKVESVRSYAFYRCKALTSVNLPNCTSIGNDAFSDCDALTFVNLPNCTSIGDSAFRDCNSLTPVDLPNCTSIDDDAFSGCNALTVLILRSNILCVFNDTYSRAFYATPIASGTGYIYVPKALIEDYKVATNWSTYASQFRAIEDYPDICGQEVAE